MEYVAIQVFEGDGKDHKFDHFNFGNCFGDGNGYGCDDGNGYGNGNGYGCGDGNGYGDNIIGDRVGLGRDDFENGYGSGSGDKKTPGVQE